MGLFDLHAFAGASRGILGECKARLPAYAWQKVPEFPRGLERHEYRCDVNWMLTEFGRRADLHEFTRGMANRLVALQRDLDLVDLPN